MYKAVIKNKVVLPRGGMVVGLKIEWFGKKIALYNLQFIRYSQSAKTRQEAKFCFFKKG